MTTPKSQNLQWMKETLVRMDKGLTENVESFRQCPSARNYVQVQNSMLAVQTLYQQITNYEVRLANVKAEAERVYDSIMA